MANKVGKVVQEFYNNTPFPDYDLARFNSIADLKAAATSFAQVLDRSIPATAKVIDVGTGTGQLSAYLSLKRNDVWGIDFSDSSLKKAEALKKKLKLKTLTLKKVDILDIEQIKVIGTQFDYLICTGVLHHTGNAYQAFKNILQLVKPGGYVAIGLYHKVGRIPLQIRRKMVKNLYANREDKRKEYLRMYIGDIDDPELERGVWNDQFVHPHETTHTVGEVLKWFKRNDVKYYQSVPTLKFSEDAELEIVGLWNKLNYGYPYFLVRNLVELTWLWKIQKQGGHWVMFGRKNDS